MRKKMVPPAMGLATGLALLILAEGCSDGGNAPRTPTSSVPLVDAPAVRQDEPAAPVRVQAGGIATTYTAHYKDNQLRRITEHRTGKDSSTQQGEYEFQGARLLRYRGATLDGHGSLVLELDLQGAVLAAQKDGVPASEADISTIRNRASLLRSHALTQQATNAHSVQ